MLTFPQSFRAPSLTKLYLEAILAVPCLLCLAKWPGGLPWPIQGYTLVHTSQHKRGSQFQTMNPKISSRPSAIVSYLYLAFPCTPPMARPLLTRVQILTIFYILLSPSQLQLFIPTHFWGKWWCSLVLCWTYTTSTLMLLRRALWHPHKASPHNDTTSNRSSKVSELNHLGML